MTRTVSQNEQILSWAEQGLLDAEQMSALADRAALSPSAADWRRFLERVFTTAGITLLGVGVFFFFAWNWEAMHRFVKLALALTGLSAFAALACFAIPASVLYRSALLGCSIATGAVLALIGQTYQTGADVWQLFAIWAVLLVPWAWLSGSAASWGLFWAVGNFAFAGFFVASRWHGLFAGLHGYQALMVIALANLALLVVFERYGNRLLFQHGRTIQRLACLGVLAALGSGGAGAWWNGEYIALLFVSLLASGPMLFFYHQRRRDLAVLAMVLFWLIVIATSGLIRLTSEVGEFFLLLNAVGLFVLVSSALASIWLTRLSREV